MRPYHAPWWLPGGHLQTIYPSLALKRRPPAYRRERWDTPDGDFVDVDWVDAPAAGAPLLVLFHGLEGSSSSHYAAALMHAVLRKGWRGAVVHFRGCSGQENRLPRAYHSGDADEIDWILRRLRTDNRSIFVAGVSLGGNALLKWLGREGVAAREVVDAAAAISAPIELMTAGYRLSAGINRLYGHYFLLTLKAKGLGKLRKFPGLYSADAVRAANTLHAFDDVVTAPLHGYRDADDYWTRASSKPDLRGIAVPTLIVHARNDPFLPARHVSGGDPVPENVTLEISDTGGHVGFATGPFPGNLEWLPARLIAFFSPAD